MRIPSTCIIAERLSRQKSSVSGPGSIIITIIISLSTKNNTFCVIHMARGMMRMRIPSTCIIAERLSVMMIMITTNARV